MCDSDPSKGFKKTDDVYDLKWVHIGYDIW